MFRKTIAVALLAALLGGCASGGAVFNSETQMSGMAPPRRLLMYYNVKSQSFGGVLLSSFMAGTRKRLETCGLAVETLEFDPLSLDMRKKLVDTEAAFKPDATVFMVRDGGNLTIGSGGRSGEIYFNVKAIGTAGRQALWTARVDYHTLTQNMYVDDNLSGERFASQFVSRMAKDGLVTGCPPEIVDPPKK